MGDYKYSPADLYGKVDWEGGVMEAAFSYGIPSSSISEATPQGVELKKAWAEMEEAYKAFGPKLARVESLLDEYSEIEDPDDIAFEV